MSQASCGKLASLPTAVITPREMTTVAFSMRGRETGTTVAPRIAKDCGSPPCAAIRGAATKRTLRVVTSARANDKLRRGTEGIHHSLVGRRGKTHATKHGFGRRKRVGGSSGRVKETKTTRLDRKK